MSESKKLAAQVIPKLFILKKKKRKEDGRRSK
jgi:hypothetical protein